MAALLGAFFFLHVAVSTSSPTCELGESESGHGLLQAHRSQPSKSMVAKDQSEQPMSPNDGTASKPLITSNLQALRATSASENYFLRQPNISPRALARAYSMLKKKSNVSQTSTVNPSGAAASLDQTGYVAVADRCCQSEMIEFVKRLLTQLGMEVCIEPGLRGIVPWHSCEYGLQSFDKLTQDLLRDSADECGWLRNVGDCAQIPDYCPIYTDVIPFYDCGCSRSKASKFDMRTATLTYNNLGGTGPNTNDPAEMRFSSGTTSSGKPFDLVITALTAYSHGALRNNAIDGGFGKFTMQAQTETNFLFSFVEPGTNNPVVQEEVHMATYDLDGGMTDANGVQQGGREFVSSSGYTGYVTDPNPNLVAALYDDGQSPVRTQFKSVGQSWDNPSDPETMTADQRRNAVMFFYKNVSSFEVKFGLEGGSGGRMLFFSFECALNDRCAP